LDAVLKEFFRAGIIPADKTRSVAAEDIPFGKVQSGFCPDERAQFLRIGCYRCTIDPGQISSFSASTTWTSGTSRLYSEGIGLRHLVRIDPSAFNFSDFSIRDDDSGGLQSGKIERFCRRNASDCPLGYFKGNGSKRDIRVADMRQIREIDGIRARFIAQLARQDFATVVQDRIVEDVVDRREHDDVVAYFRHFPNDRRDGWDDACAIEDPFFFHRELMPPLPPTDNAFPETIRDGIIAESALLQTLFDGTHNSRRCPEVHIRHPHRQFIRFDVPS